jgi:hypothetical protein
LNGHPAFLFHTHDTRMNTRTHIQTALQRIALNEDINFLLTNRVPRIALTRFMGRWSRIRHPWVRDASMAIWKRPGLHRIFVAWLSPSLTSTLRILGATGGIYSPPWRLMP